MRSKELIFFDDRITDVMKEQVYDHIAMYMEDEFEMRFDIGDGYTLTLNVDMKTDEGWDYDDFTEPYVNFNDTSWWKKNLLIRNVFAECEREGDDDDDYIECDVTSLFDTELKWEVYDSDSDLSYRCSY